MFGNAIPMVFFLWRIFQDFTKLPMSLQNHYVSLSLFLTIASFSSVQYRLELKGDEEISFQPNPVCHAANKFKHLVCHSERYASNPIPYVTLRTGSSIPYVKLQTDATMKRYTSPKISIPTAPTFSPTNEINSLRFLPYFITYFDFITYEFTIYRICSYHEHRRELLL